MIHYNGTCILHNIFSLCTVHECYQKHLNVHRENGERVYFTADTTLLNVSNKVLQEQS